jgi:hypothetical protein
MAAIASGLRVVPGQRECGLPPARGQQPQSPGLPQPQNCPAPPSAIPPQPSNSPNSPNTQLANRPTSQPPNRPTAQPTAHPPAGVEVGLRRLWQARLPRRVAPVEHPQHVRFVAPPDPLVLVAQDLRGPGVELSRGVGLVWGVFRERRLGGRVWRCAGVRGVLPTHGAQGPGFASGRWTALVLDHAFGAFPRWRGTGRGPVPLGREAARPPTADGAASAPHSRGPRARAGSP